MAKSNDRVYEESEINERLKNDLPAWYFESGHICRKYSTAGWKASLMVVNTIGHLAEAAWHHPDLEVSYRQVIVKLMNHAAKGITDKDFELATKMEELIMWRPGTDKNSALDGTPDSDQYRYIIYG